MSEPVSVRIKGGGFPVEVNRDGVQLDVLKDRLNLVYGKNGSGKSTIGKAIAKYSGKVQVEEIDEVFFDPELDENLKKNIFVFNEQYIRENLLVNEKGPETIAMLGKTNVDVSKEIEKIDKIIQTNIEEIASRKDKVIKYSKNLNDLKFQILDHIKNNGYIDREKAIRLAVNETAKPNVTAGVLESVVNSVMTMEGDMSHYGPDLEKQFEEKMKLLHNASGPGTEITWIKPVVTLPFDTEKLKELLSRSVLKPELTDREKQIFAMLDDSERISLLHQTKNLILEPKASTCPLCHQDITPGHFAKLEETIKNLLDDETDRFTESLIEMRESILDFVVTKPLFPADLYKVEIQSLENASNKWNGFLQEIRDALTARIDNIYKESNYLLNQEKMQSLLEDMNNALDRIEKCKDQFNEAIRNKKQLKQNLTEINYLLTGLSAESIIVEYKTVDSNINAENQTIEFLEGDIRKQNEKKSSMSIQSDAVACEYINRQLANIFYSQNRLSLVGAENGEYILHSRGHAVSPEHVSTGERNIIALTYFFASLFRGKTESRRYADPLYVVIDDPISSFDYGNRMGITSFISMEIRGILNGNDKSKVLVLSHDMLVIRDLCSLVDKIRRSNRDDNSYNNGEENIYYYELINGRLKGFKKNDIDDEYKKLLREVYYYAFGYNDDETGIGNKMRIVLETYSNFMFGSGFKNMLDNENVLDLIPPEKHDIYQSFFARFILDGLSHAQNITDRLTTFQARYSHEEKKRNARLLLKFLYHCSYQHLMSYLKKDYYDVVEAWQEDDSDSQSAV